MVKFIYIKSDSFAKEVHDLWAYLLCALPDTHIIKEDANYIFFAVTEDSAKHLRFLSDCNMGMLLTYETEESEVEYKFDYPDMFD